VAQIAQFDKGMGERYRMSLPLWHKLLNSMKERNGEKIWSVASKVEKIVQFHKGTREKYGIFRVKGFLMFGDE